MVRETGQVEDGGMGTGEVGEMGEVDRDD